MKIVHKRMTPKEMADSLLPAVREACERAKPDLLASLSPLKRPFVKAAWKDAMQYGIPFETQVAIEILIAKYREVIEPIIGDYVKLLIPALQDSDEASLKVLKDWLELLSTPQSGFHPAVQACLNPMLSHAPESYEDKS